MKRILPVCLLVWLIGCGPTDRSKLAEEVLKTDPTFQAVLDQRAQHASQIETTERELSLRRTAVKRTIQKLRQDLVDAEKAVRKKKTRYQELIEPERRRLKFATSMAREQLRTMRVQRSSLGRSIARVRKELKTGNETWSEPERRRQDAQLKEMLRNAKRLDEEASVLTQHIQLLKFKLLLIRL